MLGRCHFPATGDSLRCGVSGGSDSLALMVLAVAAGLQVTAVHVDHGLREGSGSEAEVVGAAAGQIGARFESHTVAVEPGPNLEARAREARMEVLGPAAATGHTMDDQAETVLINLMRGAGTTGLAGMVAGPTHPILDLRRSEAADVCRLLAWEPVVDPTNADPRFVRNRVRHELLPLCEAIAGRDLVPVLCRQAKLIRADGQLLDELASRIDPQDGRELTAAPEALARRALRQWLKDPYPPDMASVERVLGVARAEQRATEIPPGRRVASRDRRLSVTDVRARTEGHDPQPGEARLPIR